MICLTLRSLLRIPPHFHGDAIAFTTPQPGAAGVTEQPFPELCVLEDLFISSEELKDGARGDQDQFVTSPT